MSLTVNGKRWQNIDIGPTWAEYRLHLPQSLLQYGRNRLDLEPMFSAGVPPERVDLGERQRAVGWSSLRVESARALGPLEAVAQPRERLLRIPMGTQVDYFLKPEDPVFLHFDRLLWRGSTSTRLRATWQTDAGPAEVIGEWARGDRPNEIPLPASAGQPARLSFQTLPSIEASDSSGEIVLASPAVYSRVRQSEPPLPERRPDAPGDPRKPASLVFYLIDTLRSDHLGCYGYPKEVSPNIDRFAAEAFVFERAQAQSSWTRPSVASIFSGLYPFTHGTNDRRDILPSDLITLAERLQGAGYATAMFTANGNVSKDFGFSQGFDHFVHRGKVTSGELQEEVDAWLVERDPARPFFLYVHTIDPHAPYDPPEPFRSRHAPSVRPRTLGSTESLVRLAREPGEVTAEIIASLRALYDGEIAANDESFGNLILRLKENDLYEGSWVFLTSDHGEEFFEHGGWTHGQTLYGEQLNVPLIVKPAEMQGSGGRIDVPVQHVDLTPTILEAAFVELPEDLAGRSLSDLMGGASIPRTAHTLATISLDGIHGTSYSDGDSKAWQIERESGLFQRQLYRIAEDPREQTNLAALRPVAMGYMLSRIEWERIKAGEAMVPGQLNLGEERVRELRALGYLQ